jgi:hypothetical protein
MCWFVSLGFEAVVQRAAGMRSPFKLNEFHHAFLGVALVVGGLVLHSVTGIFVQLLGLTFTIDDTYQHQVQTLNGFTAYRSPLHQLFARYLWPLAPVRALTRFLDRWWFAGVVFGLLAIWIFGCAPPPPRALVPWVLRPDTRGLAGVLIDSVIGRRTGAIFDQALPREAAVCFYGSIADTVVDEQPLRFIRIEQVRPSQIDSASEEHVFFPIDPVTGCSGRGLIGWGHSHPGIRSFLEACTHSDLDANVTFRDPRLLIGIVFCADGRGEVLFQDSRRYPLRWAEPPATPP